MKPESVVPEGRLKDLSLAEPRLAYCWVMFDEGKLMADEILYLRAEVARLNSLNLNNEDIS